MPRYRIENKLDSNLLLEDVGVTLSPRGGVDSIKIIDENTFLKSRSIKNNINYLSVALLPDVRKSASPKPGVVTKKSQVSVTKVTPEVPSRPLNINIDSSPVIKNVQNQVDGLDKKVDEVIRMLRLGITIGQPGEHLPPVVGTKEAMRTPGYADPLYIPSSITPSEVKDSNVQISSQTSDTSSLDEAAEALKRLKKAKKV